MLRQGPGENRREPSWMETRDTGSVLCIFGIFQTAKIPFLPKMPEQKRYEIPVSRPLQARKPAHPPGHQEGAVIRGISVPGISAAACALKYLNEATTLS